MPLESDVIIRRRSLSDPVRIKLLNWTKVLCISFVLKSSFVTLVAAVGSAHCLMRQANSFTKTNQDGWKL